MVIPIFQGARIPRLTTLEGGTERLSCNISMELPLSTASCPKRLQISSTFAA